MDINRIIGKLKNKKYRKRGKWSYSIIFNEIFSQGESTKFNKKKGYPFKRTIGVWKQNGDYLDLLDEWEGIRRVIVQECIGNKEYFFNYATDCLDNGNELINLAKEKANLNPQKRSDKELVEIYIDVVDNIKDFMPFMFSLHLVDEYLTENFEKLLKEFINNKNYSKEKYFEYQNALALPFKKIFVLEEKANLVKIALFIKENNLDINHPKIQEKLDEHTYKYRWINAVLIEFPPFSVEDFRNKLKDLLETDFEVEYNQRIESEDELLKKQKKYMAEIKDFPELYNLSKALQIFGFLRSFRVDAVFVAYFSIWDIIKELSHRLDLKDLDIKYLTSDEVNNSLLGNIKDYKDLIKDRKQNCLLITIENENYYITDPKDIEKILKNLDYDEERITDSVNGMVAYPGFIEGSAKVLHSLEDMKNVEKGDIIVISMTDPQYIPVMEKASAFVTDFGGLLCHAAIVSREMKKPCIIGTKNATKTFIDGDKIQVDAEKGVVKKIK
mgnify:CR=1 FL=1